MRPLLLASPALVLLTPALLGMGSCGGVLTSETPAPDMNGAWTVTYEDRIEVEITLGGAVYTAELGVQGGTVDIEHEGQPLSFELPCEEPDIVCPAEVWPAEGEFEQREAQYPHRVWMTVPQQTCDGEIVPAEPAECGADTANPDCDDVCDGEMIADDAEAFGVIAEDGSEMAVLLGAGAATNGVNCALLSLSVVHADIVATGGLDQKSWVGEELVDGEVQVGYAGGCLWADDIDDDEDLEAVVLSASIVFTTPVSASRVPGLF